VAFAQTTGDERIYACVNNGDGTMRQVAGPDVACNKSSRNLSWSAEQPAIPTTTTYTRTQNGTVQANNGLLNIAYCDDPDDVVVSGGYEASPNPNLHIYITAPFDSTPRGWRVGFANLTDLDRTVTTYVICRHAE
jgi:hypothetical protein